MNIKEFQSLIEKNGIENIMVIAPLRPVHRFGFIGFTSSDDTPVAVIVEAVNGCKSVNESNPMAVAKNIKATVSALHVAKDLASAKLAEHPEDSVAYTQFELFMELLNNIEKPGENQNEN